MQLLEETEKEGRKGQKYVMVLMLLGKAKGKKSRREPGKEAVGGHMTTTSTAIIQKSVLWGRMKNYILSLVIVTVDLSPAVFR